MIKKITHFLILIMLAHQANYAQSMANYTSSRTTGVGYNSIAATGGSFSSWRNTATFTQDDNRSNFTDIGFDFWYNGSRFTQYSVSSNGYLDFSTSTANGGPTTGAYGYANSQFTTSGSGTWLTLAPIYDDMTAQGGTDALGNSIKNQMTGTAPNRILTIEWINMAVYQNVTPSLNFQVKLFEKSGKIEFNYGTMTPGTAAYSYSCGINGQNLSAPPLATQLKMQQTANGALFNNTVQNALTTLPASNSQITWTPPLPANPSGTLNFTGITNSGMTLNWANWGGANHVGYAIYNSTDGINYDFVQQTAANTTSIVIAGLAPTTTYFWNVYAVSEGAISNALTGQATTTSNGNKIAIANGSWSNAATWSPSGVPTIADNVTINNGVSVTIDINANCNALNIGQGTSGTLTFGNNATVRNLLVNTNLVISTGAILNVNTGFTAIHTCSLGGNIVNNGTLNLAPNTNSVCNITFTKNGDASISGTGSAPVFNRMLLNMGNSINNTLEVLTLGLSVPANFLSLQNGTFKLSTSDVLTLNPFNVATTIPAKAGLQLNSANAVMNTSGGTITLFGRITVSNGVLNLGNAADQDLLSSGGSINLSNGAISVAGKYYSTGINNLSDFKISNGTFTVARIGSTSIVDAPFQISGPGSTFNMTGGTIVIQNEGGTGQRLGYVNTGTSSGQASGGTLQIGNANTATGRIIAIRSNFPIQNLRVFNANVSARLDLPLTVNGNIDITLGNLNANNQAITILGNWNNTGTFTSSTSTVTFAGISAQTINRVGGETFNNLIIANTGLKNLASPVITNASLTINNGSTLDISTNNHAINIKGNFINNGNLLTRNGTITFDGSTAQTINGTTITNFNNLTINNATGVSITSPQNLINTMTLSNGTFTTTGQTFTLISNAAATARIAPISATSTIVGNINMQRYLPVGPTGWYFLGAPISSAITLGSWNSAVDFIMTGFPGSNYPNFGFTSIYTYNEAAPGIKDSGYLPATNITNPITFKKGYWAYIGPTNDITVSASGAPGMMNQSFPLTYTPSSGGSVEDGWNLISNPYPSSIDWNSASWTKTNVSGSIYIWNPATSSYASYVAGVGINGGSNIIPSSQAFWVQTTANSPALTVREACKSSIDQAFLKSATPQNAQLLRLTLSNQTHQDETVIRFKADATKAYDDQLDAMKFFSFEPTAPNLSSLIDTMDAGINSLPILSKNEIIPLRTKVGVSGTYTLSWENELNLSNKTCFVLEDRFNGTMTDMKQHTNYSFTISDTTNAPRFFIHAIPQIEKRSTANTCSNTQNGMVIAKGYGPGAFDYIWTDSLNRTIQKHLQKQGADTLKHKIAGTYRVKVVYHAGYCTAMEDTIRIGQLSYLKAAFIINADTSAINQHQLITCTQQAPHALKFAWYFGDYKGLDSVGHPSYLYRQPGKYTIQLIASDSLCKDTALQTIYVVSILSGSQNDYSNENSIRINTSHHKHYIDFKFNAAIPALIQLRNIEGKQVIPAFEINALKNRVPLNTEGLQAGLYVLTIYYADQVFVKKITVSEDDN